MSGIMLGKTMGRGRDLAERFTGESKDIADLEVRSRMAGRWVMSTIQMTFAIQPAIIYWLAGQSFIGAPISIGTVVAFTTLQTRLLFPIQSLLGVGADIEASLALFDRIFEYLDLPVDIVEAEPTRSSCAPTRSSARSGSRTCPSATRAGRSRQGQGIGAGRTRLDPAGHRPGGPGGDAHGDRRRDGRRARRRSAIWSRASTSRRRGA